MPVLKHIAAIAKGLNKAELHVLVELASRAEAAGGHDAIASSRELAEKTGLARSSVQLAIDSLNRKEVIHSDAGSATRCAMHRLLFLDAVEIQSGGPVVGPEVARSSSQGGLKTEPGVARIPGQCGLNSRPVTNGKTTFCEQRHRENASVPAESIKIDFDELIDRLQKAKKSDFKNDVFEQARNLIASHHAKFAREGWQIAGLPDDQITAQFLAIADWPRLSNLLYDLMSERKQSSHSWGWYVTVALQRMHGISPERVREIRQKIRHLSPDSQINNEAPTPRCSPMNAGTYRGGKPGGYEPAGLTTENLQRQLRAVASSKFMR